jgi:NADPH:quinone reductase-like Zn-dependent oxidoreductase
MKSLHIIVRRLGGPEVLETLEREVPEPARGEARVCVFAAGVSFADLLMREGVHPEKQPCHSRRDGTSWVWWKRPERTCRKQ